MSRWLLFALCLIAVAPGGAFASSTSASSPALDEVAFIDPPPTGGLQQDLLTTTATFDCVSGGALFCDQSGAAIVTTVSVGENTVATVGNDLPSGEPFSSDNSFAMDTPGRASMSTDLASVVPEPSSILLLGTGVLAIVWIIRRKRKGE